MLTVRTTAFWGDIGVLDQCFDPVYNYSGALLVLVVVYALPERYYQAFCPYLGLHGKEKAMPCGS